MPVKRSPAHLIEGYIPACVEKANFSHLGYFFTSFGFGVDDGGGRGKTLKVTN